MRHFATALVLLVVGIVATEVVLQFHSPPPVQQVVGGTATGFQSMLVPSPTMHHEMLRLSRRQTSDGTEFQINSLGVRGSEPPRRRPVGQLRIIVLGDQSVLGPDLPEEQTVPGRLRIFLSKSTGRDVEVINAGVPGYSPLLSWLQFRHGLQQLDPDIVVLHFDMTDVADDRRYRGFLKETEGQQICVHPLLDDLPHVVGPAERVFQNSALMRRLCAHAGLSEDESLPAAAIREQYEWTTERRTDLRLQIQHALAPLTSFRNAAEQESFRFLVSTAPVPWQVTSSAGFPGLSRQLGSPSAWPVTDDLPFQIVRAACAQNGIPFCDATDAFRSFSQPDKLFIHDSPELSAYGSVLYAREITSTLLQTPEIASLFSGADNISAGPRLLN